MPELPEVETVRRRIAPHLAGERIREFVSLWPRQAIPSPSALRRALTDQKIASITRHGKRLLFLLAGGQVLGLQLGMSGNVFWENRLPRERKHLRAYFRLRRGFLLFYDARKFGRIILFENAAAARARLGPDALRTANQDGALAARAARSRKAIKSLLLDQAFLAGVGNIYADEALFRARIHPATPACEESPTRLKRLLREVRRVLLLAIRCGGTSFDWVWRSGRMQYRLQVYGRTGQRCLRCGAAIQRMVIGGRSAHFCPECQENAGRGRHGRVDKMDEPVSQGGK